MSNILVVDDSEVFRAQLRSTLEKAKHHVIAGKDGYEGLELLNSHKDTHLILCDLNMPGMDGLTMCQRVRENPEFKSISILMLTTEASPEDKARGKALGINGWITKPYSPQKLLAGIEKLLPAGIKPA